MYEYGNVFALAFVMAFAAAFYAFDAVYAFGKHNRVKHGSYLGCLDVRVNWRKESWR